MATKKYSALEVAKMMGLQKRAVQARAARYGVKKQNGQFIFTAKFLEKWGVQIAHNDAPKKKSPMHNAHQRAPIDNLEVGLHKASNGNLVQVFTEAEYKSFENALQERKHLLKQVAELEEWRKTFFTYTSERNHIEAKEKGLIKDLDVIEVSEVVEDQERTSPDDSDIQKNVSAKRAEKLKQTKAKHDSPNYRTDYIGWMNDLSQD